MIKWQEWDLGCHMFRFTVYKIEFYRIWFVLWPYYLSGYVTVYRLLRSSTSKLSSPISLVCTRQWKCWRQQSPRSLGKLRHITCLILSICYEIARTPFPLAMQSWHTLLHGAEAIHQPQQLYFGTTSVLSFTTVVWKPSQLWNRNP